MAGAIVTKVTERAGRRADSAELNRRHDVVHVGGSGARRPAARIWVWSRAAAQVHATETWWLANGNQRLEILAFWHAGRGSQPPI
jgi:hypothetical protein